MAITIVIPDLLNQVVLLSILAGALSLYDGILRARASKVLGIIEIIVGALVLLSVFVDLGITVPILTLTIVLEVLLLILTFYRRGMKRGAAAVTIIALVLTTLLLVTLLGWLDLPVLT